MAEYVAVENLDVVREIVAKYDDVRGPLMMILQDAQNTYGYLPLAVQRTIAEELNIPLTEVYGVVTFYSQFSLTPKGKYQIGVCLGTACYVRGSQAILDKVNSILGTKTGDTTEDGKFTIEATRCIGACGLAPVMLINDDVYGRLDVKEVPGIMAKYTNS